MTYWGVKGACTLLTNQVQPVVSDATVGSEQIKHADEAMHEPGIPVVCSSDTSVSGTTAYVSPSLPRGYPVHWWGESSCSVVSVQF